MGQQPNALGLPSQRGLTAPFNLSPTSSGLPVAAPSDDATPSNPLSKQGVTKEVYKQVRNSLNNPNGDAFGALPAVAPAAANALSSPEGGSAPASAENPLAEMFNPKYMAAGTVIGLGAGMGLEKLYKMEDASGAAKQPAYARLASRIPGAKWGAAGFDERMDRFIAGRSPKGQELLNRMFNRHEPGVMNKKLYQDFVGSANKRFNVDGVFEKHFSNIDNIEQLDKQLQGTQDIRKSLNEGIFSSIKRGFHKVAYSLKITKNPPTPQISKLIKMDPNTGKINAARALTADEKKLVAERLNGKNLEEALLKANNELKSERELFKKLQAAGYKGDFHKFSKQMKAPRSFAKGQGMLMKQYQEKYALSQALKDLGPAGRAAGHTGQYLKRAFGMESFSGGANGPFMKMVAPGILGALTIGLAFSEAKKGETQKDKNKLFTREIVSGTVANLAGFEFLKQVRKLGVLEKVMGKFALKGLGRFSWIGTLAEVGIAMGISGWVLTPMLNKGFDKIFGKAKTKEDAEKAKANQVAPVSQATQANAQAQAPQSPFSGALPAAAAAGTAAAASAPSPQAATSPEAQMAAAPVASQSTPEPELPEPSSAPSETKDDAYLRPSDVSNGSDVAAGKSPFALPPKSSKPPITSISLDEIRRNPAAENQDTMEGELVGKVNKDWKGNEERLVPAGLGGSEH